MVYLVLAGADSAGEMADKEETVSSFSLKSKLPRPLVVPSSLRPFQPLWLKGRTVPLP